MTRHTIRKTEREPIDGTPEKRMFWSIISDYDLQTGLCELIDNALDLWMLNKQARPLAIKIELNIDRQLISVEDNAGGVQEKDLRLLIAPGGSSNAPFSEIIGVFGVGSKRASIALGEHVEIRTRYKRQGSFQLDITKDWLHSNEWELPSYSIPDITPNTTRVDISQLRRTFSRQDVNSLKTHLGETYSWFISRGATIEINGTPVTAIAFDKWAYPPEYLPRKAEIQIAFEGLGEVAASITSGLIMDRNAEEENYGIYFYCNQRLIVKELKTRDVGYFITREAGVPHPDASLARTIVQLQGPARAMPWNSSKSAINYSHFVFQQIRPTIIQLNSFFTSLSRRLKDDWPNSVYQYSGGRVQPITPATPESRGRMILPELPKVNKSRVEHLKARNKSAIAKQPWTLGLVEAIGAVDIITRQKFDTRNRIALILLDSNFEISLKEFIVHRDDLFPAKIYTDTYLSNLFKNRTNVLTEISGKVTIPKAYLDKAKHYYLMRNKLIHERATVGITDTDVQFYRETIERVLQLLFKLRF